MATQVNYSKVQDNVEIKVKNKKTTTSSIIELLELTILVAELVKL